jgi:hypothetical protein
MPAMKRKSVREDFVHVRQTIPTAICHAKKARSHAGAIVPMLRMTRLIAEHAARAVEIRESASMGNALNARVKPSVMTIFATI